MQTRFLMLVVIATAATLMAGCARVEDPWVGRGEGGYWAQHKGERERSPEKQDQLRERLLHSQIDRGDPGIHQTNRL